MMRRRSEIPRESAGTAFAGVQGEEHSASDTSVHNASTPVKSERTLKTRAVYYLSKRDYSRAELSKKLSQPSYKARQRAFMDKKPLAAPSSQDDIEQVLDDLQRQGFLNDQRFALAKAQQQSHKHGASRVMVSLSMHQLDASTTQQISQQLKDTELERCYSVWSRRFSAIDVDDNHDVAYDERQAQRAKQSRFLLQRGFSSDAIKRVLKGWQPEKTD